MNYLLVSIEAENAFVKIEHLFMPDQKQILSKLRLEKNFLNIKKAHMRKATATPILNDERLIALPPRYKTRHSCPLLLLLLNIILGIIASVISQELEIKRLEIAHKMSLFTRKGKIIYIKIPKNLQKFCRPNKLV